MNNLKFRGVFETLRLRKHFGLASRVPALFLAAWIIGGVSQAAADEFKTYDMMGFTFTPQQHRDNGLEKVLVLYECAMFYPEYVHGVNNCPDSNDTTPAEAIKDIIELRALQTLQFSVPVVAIDIEGGDWELRSSDPMVVQKAVNNWKKLIQYWQAINPVTKILIYGVLPRVAWELQTGNQESNEKVANFEALAEDKIASLFVDDQVAIWPSAYVYYDHPDYFRAERQWQIDICHRVYETKCYFAIMPQFTDYYDLAGFRLFMDQSTFLDIMKTLKEDGADGFGLWIDRNGLTDDYEARRQTWSWTGGSMSTQRDKDLMWMNAVESFLVANNAPADDDSESYCIDSILLAAQTSCPSRISRRFEDWNWLKKFGSTD